MSWFVRVLTVTATVGSLVAGCYSSHEESGATQPRGPKRPAAAPAPSETRTKTRTENGAGADAGKKEPKQSYAEAWGVICNAERLSGVDSGATKELRESVVTSWIVQNLKNKKARYWFIAMGNMKPPERLPHFLAEARRAGYPDCPVAKILFPRPPGPKAD